MECMCAQTRPRFTLSSERDFGEWSQNLCELQGKNSFHQKNSPQRRIKPMMLHQAGQAQDTPNKLFRPRWSYQHSQQAIQAQMVIPTLPTSYFCPRWSYQQAIPAPNGHTNTPNKLFRLRWSYQHSQQATPAPDGHTNKLFQPQIVILTLPTSHSCPRGSYQQQ